MEEKEVKTRKQLSNETVESYVSQKPSYAKIEDNIKYYKKDSQNILDKEKHPEKKVIHILENAKVSDDIKRNRVPLTYARLITEKATAFSFAIPVEYLAKSDDDDYAAMVINAVLEDNKINAKQIELSDSLYGTGVTAEIWFIDEAADNISYDGGKTKGKPIKVKVLSTIKGERFYPIFDNSGSMSGFVREYKIRVTGSDKFENRIEILHNDYSYVYKQSEDSSKGYTFVNSYINRVGKILAIYGCQNTSDFEDVKGVIDRLSALVSGMGDINDYNAAPILAITGIIRTLVQKGEKGGVLQLSDGADAKLLESSNNFKGVELEISTLRRAMQELSQTPSLAFEDLKGITNLSGKALTIMLTDALLKATRKQAIWSEYLQRRINVIKAILKEYHNIDIDNAGIAIKMTNYTINDFADKVNDVMALAGGKSLISRETALRMLGLDINIDEEVAKLEDADNKAFNFSADL